MSISYYRMREYNFPSKEKQSEVLMSRRESKAIRQRVVRKTARVVDYWIGVLYLKTCSYV